MYEIITDSAANLTDEIIDKYNINIISLIYRIGNEDRESYVKGQPADVHGFYERMRAGEAASTAQITRDACESVFKEVLDRGNDLIHIGFSSALSGSYSTSTMVAEELREQYPDRKIYTVDSLCAALGQGLLVYHAALLKEGGMNIDDLKTWLENNLLRLCHWFTVDDLKYLKRGGRISAATALVGTIMGIKPILHVDDEGRLVPTGKVRGRRQSIEALFNEMKNTCQKPTEQVIFIGHGDCIDDARYLEKLIREQLHVKDVVIGYVDAVIGAHSGPGTLALFFLGSKR